MAEREQPRRLEPKPSASLNAIFEKMKESAISLRKIQADTGDLLVALLMDPDVSTVFSDTGIPPETVALQLEEAGFSKQFPSEPLPQPEQPKPKKTRFPFFRRKKEEPLPTPQEVIPLEYGLTPSIYTAFRLAIRDAEKRRNRYVMPLDVAEVIVKYDVGPLNRILFPTEEGKDTFLGAITTRREAKRAVSAVEQILKKNQRQR